MWFGGVILVDFYEGGRMSRRQVGDLCFWVGILCSGKYVRFSLEANKDSPGENFLYLYEKSRW